MCATAIALVLSCVTSKADGVFYKKDAGQWSVVGAIYKDKSPPKCIIDTQWASGEKVYIINDLADDELYFVYHNPDANNTSNKKEVPGIIEFRFMDDSLASIKIFVSFRVTDKNTIQGRHLDYKGFMAAFMAYDRMSVFLNGKNHTIIAGLKGTENIPKYLAECVNTFNGLSPKKKEM